MDLSKIEIEKDVPVPGIGARWHSLIEKMVAGDSFLLDTRNLAASFVHAVNKAGHKGASRKEAGGEGKIRVWMVERKEKELAPKDED